MLEEVLIVSIFEEQKKIITLTQNKNAFQLMAYHPCNTQITKTLQQTENWLLLFGFDTEWHWPRPSDYLADGNHVYLDSERFTFCEKLDVRKQCFSIRYHCDNFCKYSVKAGNSLKHRAA